MKTIFLSDGWRFSHLGDQGHAVEVSVPHDAMLAEGRSDLAASGINAGWFEGADYEYVRTLEAPAEWADAHVVLELEGVYHNAEVWVNGRQVAFRPYGYTNFYVDLDPYLSCGAANELRVVARNSDQPNSRWYSGAGMYRPAELHVGPRALHLPPNAIRVTTTSTSPAAVRVDVTHVGTGTLTVTVSDAEGAPLATRTAYATADGTASFDVELPGAPLWSPESPELLCCTAALVSADGACSDEARTTFGVRALTWDTASGLAINGERVILRGACDHHTNGILGALCDPDAVERKVRLLKANGYNAIRSAHNPCSKALLEVCDRLGVLVMDEYIDHWYIHKTHFDYVDYFDEWWRQDLADMVDKDYNHPCVVMYSTGNEVSETAQPRGIELAGELTEHLHALDATRPVTCGVNIFFNFLSSAGFGVYSDEKAAKELAEAEAARARGEKAKKSSAVGSQFFNNLSGMLGDEFMKRGAQLYFCDVKTRDAYARMDVAGYNYGIYRYPHDLKKYPERLIVGSETFCADAYLFWEEAKSEPRILGDFVWAGMDYMGEVMLGAWEYSDYYGNTTGDFGWISAMQGRLDLTGKPSCECLYTQVAFEQAEGPFIGVAPVNHAGERHTPSAWRMSNALQSWAWEGCSGKRAQIEVYSRAPMIRLELNGRTVAVKARPKDDCLTRFSCAWQPGELTAVALDAHGDELGRTTLVSAGLETELRALPEAESVAPGHLAYVRLRFTDAQGTWKPLERADVHVEVEGGELIALGNGCPYNEAGYLLDHTDTYFGEALAVVRADGSGPVRLVARAGEHEALAEVPLAQ